MRKIRTYLVLTGIIFLGIIEMVRAQSYSVCSGQDQILEVTRYIPGSTFQWFENGASIPGATNKITVLQNNVLTSVTKQYSCILKTSGTPYDTVRFTVQFNPVPTVDIISSDLCEGKLASFSISGSSGIKEQIWTIGTNTYLSSSVEYYCTSKPVTVKLTAKNDFCWSKAVEKSFTVNLKPNAWMDEIALTKNFIKGVYCGNSLAEFQVNGLNNNYAVNRWRVIINKKTELDIPVPPVGKIVINNNNFIDWVNISSNSIRIKWKKTNTSYNVIIAANTNNGKCDYETELSTILVNDNTPDMDSLYQKPNKSNILIFPSGKNISDLNYTWGYTDRNKKEDTIKTTKIFYQEFTALDPLNKYWVETWYNASKVCRTRNYLFKVTKSAVIGAVKVSFYPNPVENSTINVAIENPVNGKLFIADLAGKIHYNMLVDENTKNVTIKLNGNKPGMYVISYRSDAGDIVASDNIMIK
jgi:hypothetical protein